MSDKTEEMKRIAAANYIGQWKNLTDIRQPKALTVTVVSTADGKTMHTFKIDPTKKTIVRPEHSLFGYVFEPEGSYAEQEQSK